MQKKILITGGTSGLGRALAILCREHGYNVMVTGRNTDGIPNGIKAFKVDYADLKDVRQCAETLIKNVDRMDFLVNNTGILAPSSYQETADGFELSYQVNFLSHVLLTTVIRNAGLLSKATLVNVSSPILKYGQLNYTAFTPNRYNSWKVYSNTKLYMHLFSKKLVEYQVPAFTFNPGTFSSGIYRSQKTWFHTLYKIAAPFMKSSELVASGLLKLLINGDNFNGCLTDRLGKRREITLPDSRSLQLFWENVEHQISKINADYNRV